MFKTLLNDTIFINFPFLCRKGWPMFDNNRAFMARAISPMFATEITCNHPIH